MVVDSPDDSKRRVCEKCGWDQDADDYATAIDFPALLSDYHARLGGLSPEQFRSLYLCEFPPPPKVGDGAMWKGRAVFIKAIEPGGERDWATVQDAETGKERGVRLSTLAPL